MPAGVEFVQRDVDFLESVDPREKSKSDKDKWMDFALDEILDRS